MMYLLAPFRSGNPWSGRALEEWLERLPPDQPGILNRGLAGSLGGGDLAYWTVAALIFGILSALLATALGAHVPRSVTRYGMAQGIYVVASVVWYMVFWGLVAGPWWAVVGLHALLFCGVAAAAPQT